MSGVMKVSSGSKPQLVAGAIAGAVRECGSVEILVVGAGALNQAVKAIVVARDYVADAGMDLSCRPTFAEVEIAGEARTAIRLLVEIAACEPDLQQ
jgi:stage V sporulation protein S